MANATAPELVALLLNRARTLRASDIHGESTVTGLRVRFRIDGLLHDVALILPEHALRVITYIKVLARLDIGERRLPQDGKILFSCDGDVELDIRVATFPGMHGEIVVLRILDQGQAVASIAELGMPALLQAALEARLARSQGLYIVTGPTGAGKSTTLYAMMRSMVHDHRLLITLEDPIEYTIAGAVQAQVRPEIGLGFSEGIRAILRQDPDVIMIGEMRDRHAADAALRAALTGHMVVSTLHTVDAVSGLTRLREMSIPSYLIAAVVSGIIAQRLVRKLCERCKVACTYESLGVCLPEEAALDTATQVWRAQGCDACYYRGYWGRLGIFEACFVDEMLRELIVADTPAESMRAHAVQGGMKTLWQAGRDAVVAGTTSVDELLRAIG